MAQARRRRAVKVRPPRPPLGGHEPKLVRISLKVPKRGEKMIGTLGLAFGCGGAVARRRARFIEIDAIVEVNAIAEIVAKGVPVLATERIAVEPLPARELAKSAKEWLTRVRRLR